MPQMQLDLRLDQNVRIWYVVYSFLHGCSTLTYVRTSPGRTINLSILAATMSECRLFITVKYHTYAGASVGRVRISVDRVRRDTVHVAEQSICDHGCVRCPALRDADQAGACDGSVYAFGCDLPIQLRLVRIVTRTSGSWLIITTNAGSIGVISGSSRILQLTLSYILASSVSAAEAQNPPYRPG